VKTTVDKVRFLSATILALTFSLSAAATDPSVEIRFCPAGTIRTYPLESRREIQSLVLQNLAVVNHGSAAFKINAIELELLHTGQVIDSKKLDAKVIQRFADRGAKLQASGMLEQVAFQFCGGALISPPVNWPGQPWIEIRHCSSPHRCSPLAARAIRSALVFTATLEMARWK
jgi:hypothetical protein